MVPKFDVEVAAHPVCDPVADRSELVKDRGKDGRVGDQAGHVLEQQRRGLPGLGQPQHVPVELGPRVLECPPKSKSE